MKLGELFIELGITGDIKPLKKALSGMDAAKIKAKLLTKYLKDLKTATTAEEKALVKKNFAQQINTLRTTENIKAGVGLIAQAMKITAVISAAVVAFDRLGNSVLKANQLYKNFDRQTGISITRLNRLSGVARLAGMNMSAQDVAGDLTSLQQRIFRLGLTGEGSGIFAQLGMNPLGMDADQFIYALRKRTQGLSGSQKSYILDELGLSREWLNVLELSNEQYQDFVEQSKKLQLTEKERKELAKYTAQQQKNNMRWELAKQKIAIATLPIITKIMEAASKIAVALSERLQPEKLANVFRDIALLLGLAAVRAGMLQRILSGIFAISGLKSLLSLFSIGGFGLAAKGAGGLAAKGVAKTGAKFGARALGAGVPILNIALGIWTLVDLFKLFTSKQEQEDNELPVDSSETRYHYQNVRSNMINNFYNNPVPQSAITDELADISNRYLKETRK